MTFVNLTPHVTRIRTDESSVAKPLESDIVLPAPKAREMPAIRIGETITSTIIVEGVRIRTTKLGEIEGLPEPQEGVVLVVSMPTAERAYALGRRDVVSLDSGKDAVRFKLPNGNEGIYAVRALRFIDGE